MDMNFLRAQAERCRSLAENTDEFTKRRWTLGRHAHSQGTVRSQRSAKAYLRPRFSGQRSPFATLDADFAW